MLCMSKVWGGASYRSWWPLNITSFHWRGSHGKNSKHIYTTYPQSLIISRIYRLGENRRFTTPTLHDFSWRYFSYIYNRDISGHPVLYDHYVSMPPAPPCSDMTHDPTLPPLHHCPPSVTGKSRIIRWESESQWSESEVDRYNKMSQLPAPATFSRNPISNLAVTKKTARVW